MAQKILIIGGTGVFGKRLVRHLAGEANVVLYLSSRSAAKAAGFIKTFSQPKAKLHPLQLDSQGNLKEKLDQIRPDIVVDCSGPFQWAGYETALAALEAGAHFIDLADARDYLAEFSAALDETARRGGVCALTGASSTPTLSTCAVKHLTDGWQRVDSIDIAITPGGKSEVGRSVIEAILSYAGKDVPLWVNGRLSKTTGWLNAKLVELPGLRRRRVAAVETFDAEYLGQLLQVQSRVSFSAGLESRIEQRGIETLAALRKGGFIGSLQPLISPLLKARVITRIPTSSSGGMLVDVRGLDADGVMTQTKWALVARQDHGPNIPILPAAALIRKILAGSTKPGADFAHAELSLAHIQSEMQRYDIKTTISAVQTNESVFESALGLRGMKALPQKLRQFHEATGPVLWSGQADVTRGRGPLSRLIGWLFKFPEQGRAVPITVSIDRIRSPKGRPIEFWTRSFAGKSMTSTLSTLGDGLIYERFSPFTFGLRLEQGAKRVQMSLESWKIGKLPLPFALAPRCQAKEYIDNDGRYQFDVKLYGPLIGLMVHYRGWLEPESKG